MSEPLDLDALEALAEAATPGPWEAVGFYVRLGDGFAVALANSRQEHSPSDAAFIAAARTAVPALVAEVRKLRTDGYCCDRCRAEERE